MGEGAIPLHFQMRSFCLNGVSAEEQKVKQKWAFSTFHTAERRQHRPPLRGGQCAKAQSEWRQVSARRRQAHWRQAQWWHEQLRGRRTSHQYGSNAAGMREAAAEAVAAAEAAEGAAPAGGAAQQQGCSMPIGPIGRRELAETTFNFDRFFAWTGYFSPQNS